MTEEDYHWLFSNQDASGDEAEDRNSEEDLDEIQNILYSQLHYEPADDQEVLAVDDLPYELNLEIEQLEKSKYMYSQQEHSSVVDKSQTSDCDTTQNSFGNTTQSSEDNTTQSSLANTTQDSMGHTTESSVGDTTQSSVGGENLELDLNKINHILNRKKSATNSTSTPLLNSRTQSGAVLRQNSSLDESIIDLDSSSDPGNTSKQEYIVIDTLSDNSTTDSDVEVIEPPVKKRKMTMKGKSGEDVIVVDSITSTESSESSSSSSSDSASDSEMVINKKQRRSAVVTNIQMNTYSKSNIVLNCDDLDLSEINMSTTLEDIHASLQECDWSLIKTDRDHSRDRSRTQSRYYTPFNIRCHNCEQMGHLSKLCPKPKKKNCCLCGDEGHDQWKCPQKLCHNCDQPGHESNQCKQARRRRYDVCKRCQMQGHKQYECSDIWRQYHLTTSEGDMLQHEGDENPRVYCYNCGNSGHLGYECEEDRMHQYVTVTCPFISRYDNNRYKKKHKQQSRERSPDRKKSQDRGIKQKSPPRKHSKEQDLRNKLQGYISNAKKSLQQSKDREDKMEYKYEKDFPRGKGNTTGEQEDDVDCNPPSGSSEKSVRFQNFVIHIKDSVHKKELCKNRSRKAKPNKQKVMSDQQNEQSKVNDRIDNKKASNVRQSKTENKNSLSSVQTKKSGSQLDRHEQVSMEALLFNKAKGILSKKSSKKLDSFIATAKLSGQYNNILQKVTKKFNEYLAKINKTGVGTDSMDDIVNSSWEKSTTRGNSSNSGRQDKDSLKQKHWRSNPQGFRFSWNESSK